ncbi:Integrase core domain [Nesidiocoris tenuis]|uniref:Integrase core domain n=1 Tax=Nesidiocoris tenuis TaxID=355587 RepID=A0ABN7B693_9HEMI|nr:Integrase core domain [Nesidiocoris tenuis]
MSLDTGWRFRPLSRCLGYFRLLVDHFRRYAHILPSKGHLAKINLGSSTLCRGRTTGILLTDQYGGLSSDDHCIGCSGSGSRRVYYSGRQCIL